MAHFKELRLKKLTATCYDGNFGQLSLFEDYDEEQQLLSREKEAYKAVIQEVPGTTDMDSLLQCSNNHLEILKENGDFASSEAIEIMKTADVVVTNPPFSLFRKLLNLLKHLEKDFILLGPSQAVVYSEAFQWFQAKQIHLGATPFSSSLAFEVPCGSPYDHVEKGHFFKKVPIAWYSSFRIRSPVKKPLLLSRNYLSQDYARLDQDDSVINVDKVADIPKNYDGKIAVPITFLAYWDDVDYQLLGKIDKAMVKGQEKFTRLLIERRKDGKQTKNTRFTS